MKNKKGKKVICPKCNHRWRTRSKMMYITCPNCQRKIKPGQEDTTEEFKTIFK